ncbi:MAG TPA: transporter, partial [Verrucomicrobiota bacterium]|nr:transporter [Verrucomicrobiota bacterium]
MMPRWDKGWGLQLIDEYRHEDDLLLGKRTAYSGFTEDVHLLHFQGVYTWDRSVRLTYKLPYVL